MRDDYPKNREEQRYPGSLSMLAEFLRAQNTQQSVSDSVKPVRVKSRFVMPLRYLQRVLLRWLTRLRSHRPQIPVNPQSLE